MKQQSSRLSHEDVKKMLNNGIAKIYSSQEWKNYLILSRNISEYSTRNKILVYTQKPTATAVKGRIEWSALGRTIKPKAKPIYICRHVTKNEPLSLDSLLEKALHNPYYLRFYDEAKKNGSCTVTHSYFDYYPVYDISDTEGKDIPHSVRRRVQGDYEFYEEVIDALCEYADFNGISVSFKSIQEDDGLKHAYGYFHPLTNAIVLRDNMGQAETIQTFAHELAHGLLHGKKLAEDGHCISRDIPPSDIREIQAESVAYVVCQEIGIDSGCDSFGYIAKYAKQDSKKIMEQITEVMSCTDKIVTALSVVRDKYTEKERE